MNFFSVQHLLRGLRRSNERQALLLSAVLFAPLALGAQTPASAPASAPAASQSSAPVNTAPADTVSPVVQSTGNGTTQTSRTNRNDSQTSDQQTRQSGPQTAATNTVAPAPTQFQEMVRSTTGRLLPIFGADLFNGVPSTFAPVTDVPVSPGYLIGPGDELNLQLSGQVNQQLTLTVDRTGAVSIPGIGSVSVAGIRFGDLPALLNRQFGRIYRNYTLNVNLGSLRTIQVFVTGQARRPGSYTISSLSTLLNAIFASGGPLPQGSLRDIQVIRGGAAVTHFDLYDLLLHGDKSHDIPLVSGDVIFIPVVGPQVAIDGSVNNPAIFELKGPTTVAQALHLAGGENAVAAGTSIRLERIYEHSMRSVQDVALNAGRTNLLENGDVLSVGAVLERFRDAVTLRGNVANPGRYVWHAGMRLSELFPNRESLITRNYWRQRNALGQIIADYAAPQPGALELHGNQTDRNAANGDARSTSPSEAGGSSVAAALTANTSPFGPQTDVVLSAPDIDWSYAVIERQNPETLTTSLIPFNLGRLVLEGDQSQNLELLAGDVVTIFSKADIHVPITQQTRFVRLEGEFAAAGVYSVQPGETLRGLLRRVGGFTPDAYLYGSEFTREATRRVERQRLQEYADQLEAQIAATTSSNQARAVSAADQQAAAASQAGAQAAVARLRNLQPIGRIVLDLKPNSVGVDAVPDIELQDGDRFVVPNIPTSVMVEGQVYNANAFLYVQGQRARAYLRRAGGPDRQADRKRIFILRADGSVVSRQYADVDKALILPGDTIVVPPVIDRRAGFQRIVDIAQILGNVGLSAAAFDIIYANR